MCASVVSINIYLLNPLNAELNSICHLLALLGAHHILHIGRIRVKRSTYLKNLENVKFFSIV
jgi:hypothetical protein